MPDQWEDVDDEALRRLVIDQRATLREAAEAIDDGAMEIALVVDDALCLVGTFSDGDLRRALLRGSALDDAVTEHVNRSPWTVRPSSGRAEVLDLMQAHSVSQVPIVDEDGRLTGLHVLRDLLGASLRPNAAVIMAGGRGTRLGDLTDSVPKPMLSVAGRPILERLVLHLVGSGVREIRISVNYLSHVIEDHFGDGTEFGCTIRYLREDPEKPLGTAGSLALLDPGDPALAAPMLVMNGDLVTDFSVADLLGTHEERTAKVTMAVRRYEHRVPYGVVEVDAGQVVALEEKPIETWSVNAGIYVVEPVLVERAPNDRPWHVTEVIEDCLQRGERVVAWPLSSEWHDIGRPTELRRARGEL